MHWAIGRFVLSPAPPSATSTSASQGIPVFAGRTVRSQGSERRRRTICGSRVEYRPADWFGGDVLSTWSGGSANRGATISMFEDSWGIEAPGAFIACETVTVYGPAGSEGRESSCSVNW